ncbi:MAG: hypothetical protein H6Q69_308 [Firmicutes bacterium]|nr:hypothetical protein [Bacillota bacterium]
MSTDTKRLIVIDKWAGKYMINQEIFEPVAIKLCKKFNELKYVPVPSILWVVNTESKAKDGDKKSYAKISKLADKWSDLFYQVTGRRFQYIVELFKVNMDDLTWSQQVMVIYRELRRIGADGELKHYAIEDWPEIFYSLGPNYLGKDRILPNLLEDGITFHNINPQMKLFEQDEERLSAVN